MLARIKPLYLLVVWLLPIGISSQTETLSVYFDTDKSALRPVDKIRIDSLLALYDIGMIQSINLIGLADHRGSADYNLRLSDRRANSVGHYIKNVLPSQEDNIHQSAMGELENSTELYSNRRVDIIIDHEIPTIRLDGTFTPKKIPVASLAVGNVLSIEGLNFHDRRSVLLPKSIPHLKDLEKVLKQHRNIEIEIQGHVCCPDHQKNGGDGFNKDTNESNLSLTRAKNIYDYLVRKGIKASRLKYKGLGATNPLVYPEETEKDRMKNRRVELLVTKI